MNSKALEYEIEWQYSDDPIPPVESDPYIHFVFMLRFPSVPLGKGHVAHFYFNVLQEPPSSETGIFIVSRGFAVCIPFSKPDIMKFVEDAVAKAFEGTSREDALNRLNNQFINGDIDYSDEFATDLLEADDLLTLIEKAFDGVERGDGITFHQACVIDDYGSDEDFLTARKLDTEARWQDVPVSGISKNPQFLNFLDPAGFRYYIPMAMSFAVRSYDKFDFETFFIYLAVLPTVAPREIGRGIGAAFDLDGFIQEHSFTPAQVEAIYRFICFMAIRAEHEMDEEQFAAVKKWRQATLTKTNSQAKTFCLTIPPSGNFFGTAILQAAIANGPSGKVVSNSRLVSFTLRIYYRDKGDGRDYYSIKSLNALSIFRSPPNRLSNRRNWIFGVPKLIAIPTSRPVAFR